jgi:type I restriction enzyme S subunit
MAGRYRAYPEYKNSGVEWIDTIPTQWESVPIKSLCEIDNCGSYGDEEGSQFKNLPVATTAQIDEDGHFHVSRMPVRSFSPSEIKRYLCHQGDILVVKSSGSAENIISGKSGFIDKNTLPFIFSNFLLRLKPKQKKAVPKFIYYFITSHVTTERIKRMVSATTYPNLQVSNYISAHIPYASLSEQTQIANFLDHETARIDTLIEKQQQLITLLQEKRQAVISHAVTRGLNPDAPMKDSGVEWLGEVPKHWDVVPLKYLCKFTGGGTPSKDNISYWTDGNIPWVSPKDMKSFWLSDTQDKLTAKAVRESSTNYVKAGALLMVVRSGILQRTIPIAINKIRMTLNQDMKALQFESRLNTEYAAFIIQGNVASLLLEWSKEGATVESIEHEYLANSCFPVPPVAEQIAINRTVNNELSLFSELEIKALKAINLLQERRTALISAAVTGKIDVRDWQPPTPSSTSEPLQ